MIIFGYALMAFCALMSLFSVYLLGVDSFLGIASGSEFANSCNAVTGAACFVTFSILTNAMKRLRRLS